MKLDPRLVLPAALAALVIAIPAGGESAIPPATMACPDRYVLLPLGAAFPDKNKNGNLFVCVKEADMKLVFIDDTCNPNCTKGDLQSDLSTLPDDAILDDIIVE